ncbi:low molecular weight protein-tyrosine-phosphatase [Neisseriaceae bacterium B1]
MKNILFVCLGNICRSPMAEYLMKDIAAKRGLALQIDSAGTSGWHDGEFMHCGTADVLDGMGIDSHDFVRRKVPKNALQTYDYVLVMDDNNLRDMEKHFGKHPEKLFKITDLLPENSPYNHVPDPWYTGNFNETKTILSACCEALSDKLQAEM